VTTALGVNTFDYNFVYTIVQLLKFKFNMYSLTRTFATFTVIGVYIQTYTYKCIYIYIHLYVLEHIYMF